MTFSGDFTYFLLILARMSGCIFFNPLFGRGNIPILIKTSVSLFLAVTAYGVLPPEKIIAIGSLIEFFLLIVKEIFIGYLIGYLMNLFFSTVVISGEVVDMQTGMSMSKIYDPSSSLSTGISGSFLNIILILVFFSASGHLTLINIFITSCKLIEIGHFSIPKELFFNMVDMFKQILILSLKLSMPILAVEVILESGIGILMKAIPQIQVFSVNVQLKILLGMLMIIVLVPTYATFIDNIVTLMFDTMKNSLMALN